MNSTATKALVKVLQKQEARTIGDWVKAQQSSHTYRPDLIRESELTQQSNEFLRVLIQTVQKAESDDVNAAEWNDVRDFLASLAGRGRFWQQ